MTHENTQTSPDKAETTQETPKGFEGMAKMMEGCGCCGDMMEKMKSFMPAMCCSSDDEKEKAETDSETETESKTVDRAEVG